jgi:uncharacterized membrane protein
MFDMKNIKSILWDVIEITALVAAVSVLMAVLFGSDVPFFGGVMINFVGVLGQIGSSGAALILAILVIIAVYNRR